MHNDRVGVGTRDGGLRVDAGGLAPRGSEYAGETGAETKENRRVRWPDSLRRKTLTGISISKSVLSCRTARRKRKGGHILPSKTGNGGGRLYNAALPE